MQLPKDWDDMIAPPRTGNETCRSVPPLTIKNYYLRFIAKVVTLIENFYSTFMQFIRQTLLHVCATVYSSIQAFFHFCVSVQSHAEHS